MLAPVWSRGERVIAMPGYGIWNRLAALLILVVPLAVMPRASVVRHHHAGGDRPHVHVDAGDDPHGHHGSVSDDEELYDGHDHHHAHGPRAHRRDHRHADAPQSHGVAAPSDSATALSEPADAASAAHVHTQQPYLLCLPPRGGAQIVLGSIPSVAPAFLLAPAVQVFSRPLARGPPSVSQLSEVSLAG